MADQIRNFDQLLTRSKAMARDSRPVRTVIIGADDPSHLKMADRAAREKIIAPVLIGPQKSIEAAAKKAGIDVSSYTVVSCESKVEAVTEAVKLIGNGDVDLLVRGNISTGLMLARLFERPTGLRADNILISHVAVFEHERYPKLLMMSDGAVNVAPDINKKQAIIQNAVRVANRLGMNMPRVALLAAVEVIYTAMPVTMEAAVISKMSDKGQISNCIIDGPLSMDVALVPDVAAQKGATSEVAGQADIIIAPNIETGNGVYKAMSMFCQAKTASVIVGGKIPIALSSRCDTEGNVFNSLVLGAWYSLNR